MFRPCGRYENWRNTSRRSSKGFESSAVSDDCRVGVIEPQLIGVAAAFHCYFVKVKIYEFSTFEQVGFFRNVQLNHLERKECVGNCAK